MGQYLERADQEVLRELANRVAEIAASDENVAKRELWKKHNSLQKTRPLLLVEYEWTEDIIPKLKTKSKLAREYELGFRRTIYAQENFHDDAVVEARVDIPLVYTMSDWGLEVKRIESSTPLGAWAYDPPLKDPADFSKLRVPEIEVDEEQTNKNYEAVAEAIGDILEVKINKNIPIGINQHCIYADLRGLEQMYWDLYDRPKFVEDLMEFLTQGKLELFKYVEKEGYLELNNVGSMYYTDELPQKDFSGKVRLRDLWGRSESQEFIGTSPEMFEKFLLRYQIQLLDLFGLNDYGCCEPLTDRLELIKKIPRLRRVNINEAAPETNLEIAADSLGDNYILSLRINPTIVSTERFDEKEVQRYMKERLAPVRDCILEVRLHGVRTTNNRPERLGAWSRITRELIKQL